MGSDDKDLMAGDEEIPRHNVQIRRFEIAKFPVTCDEWDLFVMATNTRRREGGEHEGKAPVVGVSWQDAWAYLDWLSEISGTEYRMPSEEEWE